MTGLAVIDKPAEWTSHDVVARVRRLLGERRVGHTGTLDPFATGVLVVLIGRATRLAQFLSGADKEYEALIRLGYATDTGDLTGTPRRAPAAAEEIGGRVWTDEQIYAALESLRGHIEQVPPMYSAKKVGGRKLYQLARRGEEIERAPVSITIHEFAAERGQGGALLHRNADGTCDLMTRVVCSAGTYVRVLAETVGERLGVGAHLAALRRTRAGAFRIEAAMSLDDLKVRTEAGAGQDVILSPEAALSGMPLVQLTEAETRAVRHGSPVRLGAETGGWTNGAHVRMRDRQGRLIAIGAYVAAERCLRPRILLLSEEK